MSLYIHTTESVSQYHYNYNNLYTFHSSTVDNDFDPTPFTVTIPASTSSINFVDVSIDVINDLRDEFDEGFLAVLELSSAEFPDLVAFDDTDRVALARVLDNDGKLRYVLVRVCN